MYQYLVIIGIVTLAVVGTSVAGIINIPGMPTCVEEPTNILCTCPENSYKVLSSPDELTYECSTEIGDTRDCIWCSGDCVIWKQLTREEIDTCDRSAVQGKMCIWDTNNGCIIKDLPTGNLLTFCNRDEFKSYVENYNGNFYELSDHLAERCNGYIHPADGCQTAYSGGTWVDKNGNTIGLFECLSACKNTDGRTYGGTVLWSGAWIENTGQLWIPDWYYVYPVC